MKQRIRLTEVAVKACFENQTHQGDVLLALYRLVLPDWDDIDRIEGWPTVNDRTWKAIARMFIDFDKVHHPNVMAGGCWMNSGFSTVDGVKLRDWEVSLQGVTVHWANLTKSA
jgi:hypothetical protein